MYYVHHSCSRRSLRNLAVRRFKKITSFVDEEISLEVVQSIPAKPQSTTSAAIETIHDTSILAQRILSFENLPKWMQIDPHIKSGYRSESNNFYQYFQSLFYIHNEFVNTWSHLLPVFFFLALLLAIDNCILHRTIKVFWINNFVIQLYIAGTAACLFLSVYSNFKSWPAFT